jgi:hypothetical protein
MEIYHLATLVCVEACGRSKQTPAFWNIKIGYCLKSHAKIVSFIKLSTKIIIISHGDAVNENHMQQNVKHNLTFG